MSINAGNNWASQWNFLAATAPTEAPTIANTDGTITITCGTSGAQIYYTTDGSSPSNSSTSYSSFSLGYDTEIIKAIAYQSTGDYASAITAYHVPRCATPEITYTETNITITCETEGATIYYTTDGSDPVIGSSSTYSSAITRGSISSVKAIAVKAGYCKSYLTACSLASIPLSGSGTAESPYLIESDTDFANFATYLASNTNGAHFRITADINASGVSQINTFTGTLEGSFDTNGNYHTISGLSHALFNRLDGGTVNGIILENVSISGSTYTGAICNEAIGASRIYNCGVLSGSVSGGNYVGGLVGLLDGTSRVINCYSFANITGGSTKAGIVGYNNYASKYGMTDNVSNIRTMVMNCMFYGDISSGGVIYPIYGGLEISNEDDSRLNNYNYFRFDAPFSKNRLITNDRYNRALAAEDRYLVRFEFYRYLLNSNRELAAYYVGATLPDHTGGEKRYDKSQMAKWVLDKSIAPYPILKKQDFYHSVVNYDPENTYDASTGQMVSRSNVTERNKGKDLGELTVNISLGTGAPSGAAIRSGKSQITLQRTDKDYDNYNFNYDKVQLPYYNEVGTGNCTKNKVVTGWKITSITATGEGAATEGTFTSSDTWDGYNFADRSHYAKDLYSQSGRVFSQGAYFDVPDGVTKISIEPYWGTAAYLADAYYDSYGYNTSQGVTDFGQHYKNNTNYSINGDNQKVYTGFNYALNTLSSTGTVYDNAIVLVGNYHQKGKPSEGAKPFTIMSADLDEDNEPDYCFIYNSGKQEKLSPIRFDFVNVPGTAMAHKQAPKDANTSYMGIMGNHKWTGWLEVTNTCFIRFSQLEYDNEYKTGSDPVILMGGVVEQMVSTNGGEGSVQNTKYLHVGSNAWFKLFNNGCHMDKTTTPTPRIPISVTGGDYEKFYLSGYLQPDAPSNSNDNAECYISGGRFGELAGAGQEKIDGDVQWLIDRADITNFYGGGINDKKSITGNITVTIKNSYVGTYCGGPKFGNMTQGKAVSTTATDCTFGTFFGAGYGGTAYYRYIWNIKNNGGHNKYNLVNYDWNGTDWLGNTTYGYTADNRGKYDSNMGIAVSYDYKHFEGSNAQTVAHLYVNYASLSIAQTNNVTSELTGCTITGNFYGGGSLGKVNGDATSTLENCTVNGSVFGAGYSGSVPKITVFDAEGFIELPNYNIYTGVFKAGVFPESHEFTWAHSDEVNSKETAFNDTDRILYTEVDLDDLGTVAGNVTLNITGNTLVEGKIFDGNGAVTAQTGGVFGGGAQSEVTGTDKTVKVNINQTGGSASRYVNNVFGGGDEGDVASEVEVKIEGTSYVAHDVYGGGNNADVKKNTKVTMEGGTVMGNVYGGGNLGDVGRIDDKTDKKQYTWIGTNGSANSTEPYAITNSGVTHVNITGGTPHQNVYGGGKGYDETFWCEKGMVYATNVSVKNVTVGGSVYGGGELGRVETNTTVTIGPEADDENTKITGSVFGAGKGVETHGYSALVRGNTDVTIQHGAQVTGNVYGGGEIASVGKYNVDQNNGMPYSQANTTSGNCRVNIPGKTRITGDIFGGGKGFVPSDTYLDNETYTGVKPKRMTIDNSWQEYDKKSDYLIYLQTLALATQTVVTINPGTSANPIQSTKGNVYGGSENGIVQHGTSVTISGDCKIGDESYATSGNIYGGGKGHDKMEGAGLVGEDATVTINSGDILGSVYGGGVLGQTKGNVTVNINDGNLRHDVYGGGAYAHTNTSNWHKFVAVAGLTPGSSSVTGYYERSFGGAYTLTEDDIAVENKTYYTENESPTWTNPTLKSGFYKTQLNLRGGTILGDAYGGALGDDSHSPKVYGDIQVDLNKETYNTDGTITTKTSTDEGCAVNQVFGCNNAYGSPQGNVTVHVYGTQNKHTSKANIGAKFVKDEYSNTAAGLYTHLQDSILIAEALNVTISNEIEALTSSSEVTALNSALSTLKTAIATELETGTDEQKDARQATLNNLRYDVQAVYGGGNQAAYEPVYPDDATTSTTQVIIDGCSETSINDVYGGGNAAAVPSTEVTVNSAYEINYLFGGGNGKSTASFTNPGADVGIHDVSGTPTKYGTGIAKTKLLGGEIHVVYGGSNEKGNIVGGTSIEVNNTGSCTLNVGQIYGAGNNAEMDGGTDIVMGCMPAGIIDEIYAGARNADVAGDVKLTITSGTFGRVFGGNKHGGKLMGSITVNIEETGNCEQPLIIGELYGGGNLADYSIYGYKNTGTAQEPVWVPRTQTEYNTWFATLSDDEKLKAENQPYADPKLNVHAFTSIGAIYGGGYRAKMVANPTVDINVAKGSHAANVLTAGTIANIPLQKKNDSGAIVDDGTTTLAYPAHEANKIGAIGNVFGGGNLAEIIGDATVNIGTEKKIYFKTEPAHLGASAYTQMTSGDYVGLYEATVEGAIIKGSVYGGGNEADITGNTQVNICAKEETVNNTPVWQHVQPGTAGVTIAKDVFGAGKGDENDATTALVSGDTKIVMFDGTVKQSVYGGGELSQVGGSTNITVNGGTIGTPTADLPTGVTPGAVYGNVYGGGQGNTTDIMTGLIKGNTEINIGSFVADADYVAAHSDVSEGDIVGPQILHNIYGGGAHGSVGTFTYDTDNSNNVPNGTILGLDETNGAGTGATSITIKGGKIGTNGKNNGMIFGSSRGDIDRPDAIYDRLAWVYSTSVIIGGDGSNPDIRGSVYGSGENGHTYQNASVAIHSGMVGVATSSEETDITVTEGGNTITYKGAMYPYRGNVYGGGCGTDKYYTNQSEENHDGNGQQYNIKAGIVGGTTTVLIDGGHVVRDVYGGGSMGSVGGSTSVTIAGNAIIGAENSGGGYVFAAARGDQDNPDKATVEGTTLNINGGTIWESAFGGGQNGIVKGSVTVNVTGGEVKNDVYGGGALANTNTDNWVNNALTADGFHEVQGLTAGESFVQGLYTEQDVSKPISAPNQTAAANTTYYRYGTTYNTTLNLTGGIIGNAYGGGLGQLQYGTSGDADYVAPIEAMVYGDVSVLVNGTAFTAENDNYTEYWKDNVKVTESGIVPKTGRVFGCNNLNGMPKGNVRVSVRQTKRYDAIQNKVVEGHESNKFEIRGVYGGGNLAHYVPYGDKKTSVDVHNCEETSIEKVYGGGNSANVPTTDVTIYGAFEIHYVFGGGNGADMVWKNKRWQENDGANVTGNASVILKGGNISDAFIGSDTKGAVLNDATGKVATETGGDCKLKLTNFYGSSKRSDVFGDVNINVSSCSDDDIQNVYGGSYDAQIHGNITMTVTSGILKNVFGGNDRLGSIGGDITINIDEADACKPIIIQNLYGGGFNAPYPGVGASKYTGPANPTEEQKKNPAYFTAVDRGTITINVKSCTRIDNIYGGGVGETAVVTGGTEVNVNMIRGSWAGQPLPNLTGYPGQTPPNIHVENTYEVADNPSSVTGLFERSGSEGSYTYTPTQDETVQSGKTYYRENTTNVINNEIGTIGNIFGGGDAGNVDGNTRVNIGTENSIDHLHLTGSHLEGDKIVNDYETVSNVPVLGAHITGNVYGGGSLADVKGNTRVYIGTADGTNSVAVGASGVTIDGDVYGGGMGDEALFTCAKAMVGTVDHGILSNEGNTEVVIGNGTISGSVYGGGKIARVENNTAVTIGLGPGVAPPGATTSAPVITGNVFGAGKGVKTHGYSALVRGYSTVTIKGNTKVGGSVYGGGEISTVGRFWVMQDPLPKDAPEPPAGTPSGMPYQLKEGFPNSGKCTVVIGGYAEIGPNDMQMPTFTGHVFGAGKGFLPDSYTYVGTDKPQRMQPGNSWDTFSTEDKYIEFVETTGMTAETDVTIQDHAFIKGSVYGGSENGHVLNNTHVTIKDYCQIGNGDGINRRYTDGTGGSADEWALSSLAECAHWPYGETVGSKKVYLPYDVYNLNGSGNPKAASDGHTFYGNVFGGGSGYFPYRKNPDWLENEAKSTEVGMPVDKDGYSDGLWLRSAGAVYGNTRVDITGGHILTSVYGGNEQTDVGKYENGSLTPKTGTGTCVVNMVGGTLGVPRTLQQIHDHPVTCYLFGAGKGDQRINFNTWTNVGNTQVNITNNARIYGSTFGGGEDGHVIGDAVTNIGGSIDLNGDNDTADEGETFTTGSSLKIGTWGTSYVDGNVFGGGRGFSGEAETAGSVGGNVTVNIENGTMLGSIYGGGRLASVGTYFVKPTDDDGNPNPKYGQLEEDDNGKTYGHIAVNISGGTIGNGTPAGTTTGSNDAIISDIKYSGNVYGGCMGRLELLNGNINPIWPELAQAKTSIVNISQAEGKTTRIYGNVYGGGELGTVRENAWVTIGGKRTAGGAYNTEGSFTSEGAPTIDGSVFGGGKGSDDHTNYTTIAVYWGSTSQTFKYTYTPMQWAGTVGGNTYVNVLSGHVKTNVYGGGQLASVGLINYNVADNTDVGVSSVTPTYTQLTKHDSQTNDGKTLYGFGLSWPYEFKYVPCTPVANDTPRGTAYVKISGSSKIGDAGDTGYVFGGGQGQVSFGAKVDASSNPYDDIAEQRYTEAFCANVRATEVTIETTIGEQPTIRTVYGGGDDGHVYEDAKVIINNGWIEHSVFGGGKGTHTYTTYLWNASSPGNPKTTSERAHSWTAGKVYGNTSVTINDGKVGWFVYGGGNLASVGKGNYSGGADDYSTGGYGELPSASGNLWTTAYTEQNPTKDLAWHFVNSGESTVTIKGGKIGPDLPETFDETLKDKLIDGDGIPYGSVFGGSRGQAAKSVQESPRYRYMPDFFLGYVNKAVINIGDDATEGTGPTIMGSVYGGGQDGHVRKGTEVRIYKGHIDGQGAYETAGRSGNVFGAGSGIGKYTDGGTTQYLNNSSGSVTCTTLVEVSGTTTTTVINGNVYGGGALASVGPYKMDYNEYHDPTDNHKSCSHTQVDIKGGRIKGSVFGASRGPSEGFLSTAFPGGVYIPAPNTSATANQYNQDRFATDIWSDVNISGGLIEGNVYGGGEGGRVTESTSVILTGGVIGKEVEGVISGGDVYGSGKGTLNLAANVGGNTSVELNPNKTGSDTGCVVRRIFGCNDLNGTPKGHASVHVYATQHRNKKAIHDVSKDADYQKYDKFENCTNKSFTEYDQYLRGTDGLSGLAATYGVTPAQYYKDIIVETNYSNLPGANDEEKQKYLNKLKTEALDSLRGAIADKKYDVVAVYGGGNLAPYEPTASTELASVVIDGCELTSIRQVYGGGNAASTPANSLLINGTYEIDEAFGGGNGKDIYQDPRDNKWYKNPGANVGYTDFTQKGSETGADEEHAISQTDKSNADTPDNRKKYYSYGSGVATTTVLGGYMHYVYGGSNKRGNIRTEALSVYQEAGYCELSVDEVTGAGKDAKTDAEAVLKMDCVKDVKRIFGGSTNADVYNDINLTITNGTFDDVFGGNNTAGSIYGAITVNIEEGGCQPIIIKHLYAGGYLAPYSVYGYETNNGSPKRTGTNPQRDPRINIISATRIDSIFGGGFQAEVVGNPHINVNMKEGYVLVTRKEKASTDNNTYLYEYTEDGKTIIYVDARNADAEDGKKHSYDKTALEPLEGNKYKYPLSLGYITDIYGGGFEANVTGSTYVDIGTGKWMKQEKNLTTEEITLVEESVNRKAADIRGSVFGGGLGATAGVTGNTYVTFANGSIAKNIYGGGSLGSVGTFTADAAHRNYSFTDEDGNPNGTDDNKNTGICNITITGGSVGPETPTTDKGNVFGAGMGTDTDYYCEDAMAYGTNVSITNGTISGSVYGGGMIARMENNTNVTIGLEGDDTSAPEIMGDVFGAGKGLETHGYSALVRGNPSVTVQGKAKVRGSVYGGGEVASVARYTVVNGSPVAVENTTSGNCKVIVRDYAEIGPDGMQMKKVDSSNNPLPPDDKGHVFGAGKGVLPGVYSYSGNNNRPKRMLATSTTISSNSTSEAAGTNNKWEFFGNDADYHAFIETLALTSMADVTIGGHAFVKGSVYGGSENGIVQYDTHVTIEGDCQIGNGDGVNRRYTDAEWAAGHLIAQGESENEIAANYNASLPECAHWEYNKNDGAPYDPYATTTTTISGVTIPCYDYTGDYSVIPSEKQRDNSDGGKPIATDGHTYYGNVYGGGSGVVPYAPGLWHRAAGIVRRNTQVDITGGHILTSVYGGNEHTDVGMYTTDSHGELTVPTSGTGKCTVNMVGGTLGVPRTLEQIAAHPVTCYLFGAGKGDQRIFFNTWTNIREAEVNVTGNARIYGSVFGGGEDGHVIENAQTNIGGSVTIGTTTYSHPTTITAENPGVVIGTTGTSYVDGNVFGAGRGYSGEALTAGSIGGNVEVNISGGKMLGSIYGGGRLASVGIGFNAVSDASYGSFTEDSEAIPATYYTADEAAAYNAEHSLQSGAEGFVSEGDVKTPAIPAKSYGHVTVNISGGTIGHEINFKDETNIHTTGGNVYGGSMGRLTLLNDTYNEIWPQLGQTKTATINITGGEIKSNVYGGGELGTVRDNTNINISGGTVGRDVYGGGYGSIINEDAAKAIVTAEGEKNAKIYFGFTPMIWAGCVGKETNVNISGGRVKKSVYGGGEMASVGTINCMLTKGATSVADNEVEFSRTTSDGTTTYTKYSNMVKHADETNSFALSWPYKFEYIPGYEGKTNVSITGGRIGLTSSEDNANPFIDKDNGDVYGAGKGVAGDYKEFMFCANVGSTEVTINYPSNNTATTENYMTDGDNMVDCIAGAVYGGGENGHVIGDTKVTLTNGLVAHSIYGGGSGKGQFTKALTKIPVDRRTIVTNGGTGTASDTNAEYEATCYSITAGKVFGNTEVNMSGGSVLRNIYGGGNMGSVGKGNYAGGTDDYYPTGYGERLNGNLWTSAYNPDVNNSVKDNAWYFLNSGKCTVKITGGTVGYVDATNPSLCMYPLTSDKLPYDASLPYGNVFGGCRGESAPNILESPRYLYSPEFFVGYANETDIIIGTADQSSENAGQSGKAPLILGSVYGGGMDGHIRRDTHVTINSGEIGMAYNSDNQDLLKTTDLDDKQWLARGNVYGAGSGIGKYKYDFNYDGDYGDVIGYKRPGAEDLQATPMKEEDFSTSAGSVTRFTYIDINGGTIHRNVYGGGSQASVGPPAIPPTRMETAYKDGTAKRDDGTDAGPGWWSQCNVNIRGTVGTQVDYKEHYGGEVYGASRGSDALGESFANTVWTLVKVMDGANIKGNVFGGGDAGMVKRDTDVRIGEPETTTSSGSNSSGARTDASDDSNGSGN
ncbi:MAG: chitobiase/beta-hexosaminidase C-terminal domain-containing protein [Prevotella sp.]|nr:chitobiase/beta-hexosaminidase C-terminal domain-containing protein [Prevotella sp.]